MSKLNKDFNKLWLTPVFLQPAKEVKKNAKKNK